MRDQDNSEECQRLKSAVEASLTAAKELTKDAAQLGHQAAVLKSRAAEARVEAQEIRARTYSTRADSPQTFLSIPEAAHALHVAERTLRHILEEPTLNARLIERTRKVGIYYKFIPLLSPDLMVDLAEHLAAKKPREKA